MGYKLFLTFLFFTQLSLASVTCVLDGLVEVQPKIRRSGESMAQSMRSSTNRQRVDRYVNQFVSIHRRALEGRGVSLEQLEDFYSAIARQVGRGNIRAIDSAKLHNTLESGVVSHDAYFNIPGDYARVGHNSSFVFLKCRRNCDNAFRVADEPGGTQLVADKPISDFEVIIPDYRAAMEEAGINLR